MIAIVCGGRDWLKMENPSGPEFLPVKNRKKENLLWSTLSGFALTFIFTGASKLDQSPWSVDCEAARWAHHETVPYGLIPAQWHPRLGKAAGPTRNGWMLTILQWASHTTYGSNIAVIAFPGGAGTENMVKQAEDAGIKVYRIKEPE